jgi:hypothetical protein
LQAGGRQFDPDWLHHVGGREIETAHTKLTKPTGVEAGQVFFDNVNE